MDCPICLQAFPDARSARLLAPCGHTICRICLAKLPQATCPICRDEYSLTISNFILEKDTRPEPPIIYDKNRYSGLDTFRLSEAHIKALKHVSPTQDLTEFVQAIVREERFFNDYVNKCKSFYYYEPHFHTIKLCGDSQCSCSYPRYCTIAEGYCAKEKVGNIFYKKCPKVSDVELAQAKFDAATIAKIPLSEENRRISQLFPGREF